MGRLIAAYTEPRRSYHTLQHLSECIAIFEEHLHLAEHPDEVGLALWFHDAVYNVRADDNEARSAAWAERELREAHVAEESIQRIRSLILATRHAAAPEDRDQKLIVDIDLAILAAPADRFAEYEAQVRAEFAWVPGPLFRKARHKILRGFLERPTIYNTTEFQRRFETRARENLADSLARLG